ncbi:MAG: PAS domain S-box protein [Planctomycetota bacterium]
MQQVIEQLRALPVETVWLIASVLAGFSLLLLGVLVLRGTRSGSVETGDAADDALAACGGAVVQFGYRGGRVVLEYASPSAEVVTGVEADALTGKGGFFDRLHEGDSQQMQRRLASAIQDERPVTADARLNDGQGRSRWVQLRVAPSRDSRGRLNKLRGVVREISEQRMLSQELQATWAGFHALAEATPAMLWVLDSDGRVTAVNRATERFCAVGEAALVGNGWLAAVADDEQADVQGFIDRVIELGTSLTRETLMIDPDNRERVIAMTATAAVDEDGLVGSVVLTGKDITDRSEAEKQRERVIRLIETSESPALIVAPDMRVSMLNTVSRQRAGLGEREPADSIALWHVVTQETVEAIRRDAINACGEGGEFRLRGQIRDGAEGSLAADLTVVGLGDGWIGLTAREVEREMVQEREAALDRRRLEIMQGVLGRLSGGGWSPGRTAQRIVESIAVAYPGMRAAFGTMTDGQTFVCEASEEPVWMGTSSGRSLKFDQAGELLTELTRGEPVLIEDTWAEPDLDPSRLTLEEHSVRSIAMLRAETGEPQMTVMTLERSEVGQWTRDHIEALRLASRLLGLAARADRERRARMAAEARAAEQTQRWRESREHMEMLASQAADKASENERLSYQLERLGTQWRQPIAAFGERVAALADLPSQARGAGLHSIAHGIDTIMFEADRLDLSASILTTRDADAAARFGVRALTDRLDAYVRPEFERRGVALVLTTHTSELVTCEGAERVWRVAAAELLMGCLRRCRGQAVEAEVELVRPEPSDRATNRASSLRLTVACGTLTPDTAASDGMPAGIAFVGRLAERLGGSLTTESELDSTRLTLTAPVAAVEMLDGGEASGEDSDNGPDTSPDDLDEAA